MFHILIKNSTPNHLVGGPWTSITESHSDVFPSVMECGLKGGQVREALNQEDFRRLDNSGNVKTERVCIRCYKAVKGFRPREREVKHGEV